MNLNFATAALVLLGIASAASEPWLDARDLPEGWEIVEDFEVPPDQRSAIGKNLGGELIDLRNTTLRVRGQTFKVNKVTCATSADSDAVETWFLKNKLGHCWDFSDVFDTLAPASGGPARQVADWLHGVSDYIPFVSSPDGELPMVYASPVSQSRLKSSSDRRGNRAGS